MSVRSMTARLRDLRLLALPVAVALALSSTVGAAAEPSAAWTRQFGTSGEDEATAVAVDAAGNIYVVGITEGALPGQTSKGGRDAFVRKLRPNGRIAWTRQFGTSSDDVAYGVAVDKRGWIAVSGWTLGTLPGQTSKGGRDAYVRKLRPNGRIAWTRQFGTSAEDGALGIAVDRRDRIVVVGWTVGTFPGQTSKGSWDGFVRRYRPDGRRAWTSQFGSSSHDYAYGVAVDRQGRIVVVGLTSGAFPGQTSKGSADAFVRRYSPDRRRTWTRQFGTSSNDYAYDAAIDGRGRIVVVGQTGGTFPGQTSTGSADAFVRYYSPDRRRTSTRQFGSSGEDVALNVVIDGPGGVIVTGQAGGALPGQAGKGGIDGFVRRYSPGRRHAWTLQLGTSGRDYAHATAVLGRGRLVVVGEAKDAFPGQVHKGLDDAFVRRYDR